MRKRVRCAVCGKQGIVEIDDKTRRILSDWCYFGTIKVDKEEVEYWECPKCCKGD